MDSAIETDYLVVGAGAAGMAFTDSLLTHSDATITLVDRRHAPGGHWIDAYPFVKLHQPSAFYGVESVPLGRDTIEPSGLNAGYYERAGADALRAYFDEVMAQHFLPSERVRHFPCSEFLGGEAGIYRFASRLTGGTHSVRVRRKLVDTTYLEGSIPATSPPPFEVADGVRCVAAGDIARISERPGRFVVIGAGKTALDVCTWLLEHEVPATAIRWIKPREGWWLNRRFHQPHEGLPDFHASVGMQLQAAARATSIDDLFARLEAEGYFLRVDASVAPSMCRGAIVSEAEVDLLRQIDDVVRMGHVQRIEPNRIVLDEGTVSTDDDAIHVHCAARGLARPPLRPVFEDDRVTVQPLFWGFACYQFALLGVIEACVESTGEKNRLCRPVHYWDRNADYPSAFLAMLAAEQARTAHPAVSAWAREARLNPLGGIGKYRDHSTVARTREQFRQFGAAAAGNLAKLLATR